MPAWAADYGMGIGASPRRNTSALLQAVAQNPGRVVVMPSGRLNVIHPAGSGATLIFRRGNLDLRAGIGGTDLHQVGDAAGVGTSLIKIFGGSGYSFGIGGGLTLSSSLQNPYEDQNHLVDVVNLGGPMRDLRFTRVLFKDSGGGAMNTGDGIRLVGSAAGPILSVYFDACLFDGCGRSGISPNRGVRLIVMRYCRFWGSSDQHIDCESSTGAHTDGILAYRCWFGPIRSGGASISMGGSGLNELIRGARFIECEFIGGGAVQGGYTSDLLLRKCIIRPGLEPTPVSAVSLLGYNPGLTIEDCEIDHYAEQGDVPAIRLYAQYGFQAGPMRISGTTVTQYARSNVIALESADGVKIEDCDLRFRYASPIVTPNLYGVWLRSGQSATTRLQIRNTQISGMPDARLLGAVALTHGSPADTGTISGVDVESATVSHATHGLYINGPSAGYLNEPRFVRAKMGVGTTSDVGQNIADTPRVVVEGQRGIGAVRTMTGRGAPEGVVAGPVGCIYLDRITGFEWFKATGTGTTGWIRS
jgi:hypothetical protein